jgi:hypothetical protein
VGGKDKERKSPKRKKRDFAKFFLFFSEKFAGFSLAGNQRSR